MKLNLVIVLFLLISNLLPAQHSSKLTVIVEGLKSYQGSLRIGLYNKAEGFAKDGHAINGAIVDLADGVASHTFHDLPAANYAVALYHDANKDDKLNTNMVGYPKENYGFSNNVFGSFGGVPTFEAAMVMIGDMESREIVVKLR